MTPEEKGDSGEQGWHQEHLLSSQSSIGRKKEGRKILSSDAKMIKKSLLAILVVVVLCSALIQGMPTYNRGRCLCQGRRARRVDMDNVAEVKFHRPSSSCDQEELVVVFRSNGNRRCLDVNAVQGRRIKQAIMKKKK